MLILLEERIKFITFLSLDHSQTTLQLQIMFFSYCSSVVFKILDLGDNACFESYFNLVSYIINKKPSP